MVWWPEVDRVIEFAKEWQPLLAGALVVLASIIVAAGVLKAARIRATQADRSRNVLDTKDLRTAIEPTSIEAEAFEGIIANLEALRGLLRSALSALSSIDADDQAAQLLCMRIAAFQGRHFALPANADKRLRETYATFLNQFEQLQAIQGEKWSPSEASAKLIQLNASARALDSILKQMEIRVAEARNYQNNG